jgi:hypothetical protein
MQCPQCQHDNSATAKFCPDCGQRLTPPAPATASPVAFAPSQAYTPPHLAEKIRMSKSVLEGERKQVTVLFSDLKGSMSCWPTAIPRRRGRSWIRCSSA